MFDVVPYSGVVFQCTCTIQSGHGSDRPTLVLHQKWYFSMEYRCTHKVGNFFKFII